MSTNTGLTTHHTILFNFRGTGNTYLRSHGRIVSYFTIMGYLYQIIQFHPTMNHSGTHHCTVDGCIGTNLHIILNKYVTHLGYLVIDSVLMAEAETIRSNDSS